MKLTDLLGAQVVDAGGHLVGKVLDVRMAQRGPVVGSFGASFQPEWLLVGPRAAGARLGYDRKDVRGPWPVRALTRRLHANVRLARWRDVRAISQHRIDLSARADALPMLGDDVDPASVGARIVDAGLELLDRQVIDIEGHMAGKCDDLRFKYPEGGGTPYVDAIVAGPGALASRIGGSPGRWLASLHARVQDAQAEGPASIGFGIVTRIGSAIDVGVHREELEVMRFEAWVRDRVIARIPGAG
jgi:sporulation protein YlmC with PRC-barrel domain